jgi:hypothetical protein
MLRSGQQAVLGHDLVALLDAADVPKRSTKISANKNATWNEDFVRYFGGPELKNIQKLAARFSTFRWL